MHHIRISHLFLGAALAVLSGVAIAAAPLPAFTARYRVLQGGQAIGEATLTLAHGHGNAWTFTTVSKGTAGLASLLSASTRETSTFTWIGKLPQGLTYDYTLRSAIKQNHRSVRFDWATHTITVDDNGTFRFPTRPGTLERHTVPLALAAGLAAGETHFALPVAVRDRVETEHYTAQGKQAVRVPAGTFDATRVVRDASDGSDAFQAWFAPGKLPAPVKIDQPGKTGLSLELESWSAH